MLVLSNVPLPIHEAFDLLFTFSLNSHTAPFNCFKTAALKERNRWKSFHLVN